MDDKDRFENEWREYLASRERGRMWWQVVALAAIIVGASLLAGMVEVFP